jgi:hypothetical protein
MTLKVNVESTIQRRKCSPTRQDVGQRKGQRE